MGAAEPWDDPVSILYQEKMREANQAGLQFERLFDPDLPDDDRRLMFEWYQRVQQAIRLPLAYAIPNPDVVHVIGMFSPIVEIGAGRSCPAPFIVCAAMLIVRAAATGPG